MEAVNLFQAWCRRMAHLLNDFVLGILVILHRRFGWPIPDNAALQSRWPQTEGGIAKRYYHQWYWWNIRRDLVQLKSVLRLLTNLALTPEQELRSRFNI